MYAKVVIEGEELGVRLRNSVSPIASGIWFNDSVISVAFEEGVVLSEDSSYLFGNCNSIQKINMKGVDTSNVKDMSYMFCNCRELVDLDISDLDTSKVTNMEGMFASCSKIEEIDVASFDTSYVDNMKSMFYGCKRINSLDMSKWDTSNVKDMSYMFFYCENMKEIGVDRFDTSNVTDMSGMFSVCSSLEAVDVSEFNTENVMDMSEMFFDCSNLTILEVDSFDTSSVTDMSKMFYSCSGLSEIKVDGFDTSNVTDMSEMFYSCSGLSEIKVDGFDTGNVIDMSGLFHSCSKLNKLDLSGFDMSHVVDAEYMLLSTDSILEINTPKNNNVNIYITVKLYDDENNEYTQLPKNLSYSITLRKPLYKVEWSWNGSESATATIISLSDGSVVDTICADMNCDEIITAGGCEEEETGVYTASVTYEGRTYTDTRGVVMPPKGHNYGEPTWTWDGTGSATAKFTCANDNSHTHTEEANITSKVTTRPTSVSEGVRTYTATVSFMDKTFTTTTTEVISPMDEWLVDYVYEIEDGKVALIKYTGDDTAIVVPKAVTVDGIEYEVTFADSKKRNYKGIWNDTGVVSITLENGFILPEDCSYLFYEGGYPLTLETIILDGIDTSKVTDMSHMFEWCIKLTSLDVSGFDTSKVTDMSHMFERCNNLTSLDVSGFDTRNVTDMSYMFCACCKLTSLDVSGFDTSKVTNMAYMFSGHVPNTAAYTKNDIVALDVSGFDTSNVTNMEGMFNDCASIVSIDVSGFDTSKVTTMKSMFCRCYKLENLDISGFDTSKVTDIDGMFVGCLSLASLDMSNFDTGMVTSARRLLYGCDILKTIKTPCGLNIDVELPVTFRSNNPVTFYDSNYNEYEYLPKNLDHSIQLTREKPVSGPVWTWTGTSKAVAKFTSSDGSGQDETVEATITSEITTAANCENDGERTYTATVMYNDQEYTDTKTEVIPASGHVYDEPTWTWTGYTKAVASFGCEECDHTETLDATVTNKVTKEATCENNGVRTYTASVTFKGIKFSTTKKKSIAAIGHSYGEPTWTWTGTSKAVAKFTCTNDSGHVKTVEATITNKITTDPTCEKTGIRTYTAKVTIGDKTYTTTKKKTVAAKGHSYGEPKWTWTGTTKAVAKFTCTNDSSHAESVTATISNKVTKVATCDTDGVRTYTAKASFNGKTYTATKKKTIPAMGHSYGAPTWKWTGYTKAVATFTCDYDDSHIKKVNATITSKVTQKATITTAGTKTYTATVAFDGYTYKKTKTEKIYVFDKTKTGLQKYSGNGGLYYVKNGVKDASFTGFAKYGNNWYYVIKGIVNAKKLGVFKGKVNGVSATWYVKDGKVQLSFTGTVTINKKKYKVVKGKVQ